MSASQEAIEIQKIWDRFVDFYGEVTIHSLPDRTVCIHLGDKTKGCVEPTFFEALVHAADHYVGDVHIESAAEEVRKNPEEGG